MILKYYHGYVSQNKLSEMMNTNQNGTTAYNLKETLNQLGFQSYGLKSKDISKLKLPFIAHLNINNSYKHYIVVYKINLKKKTLLIADPATNLKTISIKEFYEKWSGVSIHMKPINKIVYEQKPNTLKFIIHYIKDNLKLIVKVQLTTVLVSILSILSSFFLPLILSFLKTYQKLEQLIFIFLITYFLKDVTLFVKNKLSVKLNNQIDENLTSDILKKILNLPYRYYKRKTTGEITTYFNDLYVIKNLINQIIQIFFIEIPLIIILTIIILKINILLLCLLITIMSILSIIFFIYHKKQNIWLSETIRNQAGLSSFIIETVNGFETIKNLDVVPKIYQDLKNKHQNFIKVSKKYYKYENRNDFLKNIISDIGLVIVTLFIIKISNHNLNQFSLLFILSSLLIASFKNLLIFNYQLTEIKTSLSNLTELTFEENKNKPEQTSKNDIVIKNLCYSFDKYTNILESINLTIKNQSKIMLTGPSGSGKSTLFKIIKGYYPNYKGSIKIGNYEAKEYHFNDIVYISQNETLFTGTLEDNLNLKGINQLNAQICEIDDLEKGTLIEENGFNLSGGQKQRIFLARALTNFNTLIIDEGLSQVSIDMERRILKRLFKKYRTKTIIYISHRLDNLDLFDHFIKLEKGKVVINTKRNN